MSDKQFEKKVEQDTEKVKKDLHTLVGDGVTHVTREFEKIKSDAKESLAGAVGSVKSDVGDGLTSYNTRMQEYADKVPGGWGIKAAQYPWVAITVGLGIGLFLGFLLKPSRRA